MMNKYEKIPEKIPKEYFTFVENAGCDCRTQFHTKPVSYFKDVWLRFTKNRGAVVSAWIILLLVMYAVLVPAFCETNYSLALTDTNYLNYTKLPPKIEYLGIDGCSRVTINKNTYLAYQAIGVETGLNPIADIYRADYADPAVGGKSTFYDIKLDNYHRLGMMYLSLTTAQYEEIQSWQNETGVQVIYPAITDTKQTNANIWYQADKKGVPKLDKEGNYEPIYRYAAKEDTSYHSIRIKADNDPENPMAYARVTGTSDAKCYIVRVSKYTYFQYRYGFEPHFIFGTDARGQDIFTCLASGARFSFLLAFSISLINLFIGLVYGAIEGYYGGWIDLVMERISEVIGGIPFIVAATLFQLYFARRSGAAAALLFAFVLTGWIGIAQRVRMQFYRIKGQEYILAARGLGAGNVRLMLRHILPNSIGTLITGSILMIPDVIFGESLLTYLGIVNLDSSALTSVGTMLANGREFLSTDPHIILFPALFIALLEICFNLLGNGLRDAFNPLLRGIE